MKTLKMLVVGLMLAPVLNAQVYITEWMYSGANLEFIEFTNTGASSVDFTGWSFDDDSRTFGTVDLSGFGVVAAGESVILTEADAATFRTAWNLGSGVKIIGGLITNLGRNDEINLYNGSTLVDRLTFGDQNIPGSIRTQNASGNTAPANWGQNTVSTWVLSTNGDAFGSYLSTGGDIGNPGVIPEPSTWALIGIGSAFVLWRSRKRK